MRFSDFDRHSPPKALPIGMQKTAANIELVIHEVARLKSVL